jgi:Flp pilus assembly protein TadG
MPSPPGNARPPSRFQRGQAIVLIAIMLAVVVGMAALAIDGSRAYALRRDLQAAVDAAALAAGDTLQQNPGNWMLAESAATSSFGVNMRLYNAPSCAPIYGAPPVSVTCNYLDGSGTVLKQVVTALGAAGSQFVIMASRPLVLQFARILTNGTTPRLSAVATGGVNNLLYAPAVAALSQAGCGGQPGSAISVTGNGTLDVQGDVVSNGAISVSGGNLSVAGDIYARCQSSLASTVNNCYPSDTAAPCTLPNVVGAIKSGSRFADPNYPPPQVTAGSQGQPGWDVVLNPGVYANDPVFNNNHGNPPGSDSGQQCWFLKAGVYQWTRGITNDGDFISNELKPPDEPNDADSTRLARRQFWNTNGVNCAGSFRVSAIAGSPIPTGTWAIKVTSTRTDSYLGINYLRESAPSYCQTVDVGATQVIQVQISNVPGAQSYNVYASKPPNGCSGPFGLAGSIPVVGPVRNNATNGCPSFGGGCSLGSESAVFDSAILGGGWLPTGFAAPPDGETAPLGFRQVNQNPDRGVPSRGDRANENACAAAGAPATCPSAVTPGAVAFYIPSTGCLVDTNNGDNFVFSGYQYNWIAIYEPGFARPPANGCANLMDASSNSAYVGLVYMPAASLDIPTRVGFRTEATGGIIALTITFSGSLPLIVSSAAYSPVPPGARLTG